MNTIFRRRLAFTLLVFLIAPVGYFREYIFVEVNRGQITADEIASFEASINDLSKEYEKCVIKLTCKMNSNTIDDIFIELESVYLSHPQYIKYYILKSGFLKSSESNSVVSLIILRELFDKKVAAYASVRIIYSNYGSASKLAKLILSNQYPLGGNIREKFKHKFLRNLLFN
ncbi:MAG: hypothetical protein AB8E15_11980 [Bdellovibrionales bacterium]